MAEYDFKSLSSYDFERLERDLLSHEFGIKFQSYKMGPDKGIDLTAFTDEPGQIIAQCKHFIGSGFSKLKSVLRNDELPKILKLKPSRYILISSLPFSLHEKNTLVELLKPFCHSPADVYGAEDLNRMLGENPEVERHHFKLWLTSTTVLERILHSDIYGQTSATIDSLQRKVQYYVQNDGYRRAIEILKNEKCCIIAGIPGIGKTTLADMLLVHFLGHDYEPIVIARDISNAFKVINSSKKQFFYFDDFLGRTGLELGRDSNFISSLLSFIDVVKRSDHTLFVLTTRENIFNKALLIHDHLQYGDGLQKCTLSIGDYTRNIRALILYNHLYFSELSVQYKEAILKNRNYWLIIREEVRFNRFIPRIVEWMTSRSFISKLNISPEEYPQAFAEAFEHPEHLWGIVFTSHITESARGLLLVLRSLPSPISTESLEQAFLSFMKLRSSKYSFQFLPGDFENALRELDGTFININTNAVRALVSFNNPSIQDYIEYFLLGHQSDIFDIIQSSVFYEQHVWLWNWQGIKEQNMMTSRPILRSFKSILKKDAGLFSRALISTYNSDIINGQMTLSLPSKILFAIEVASEINDTVMFITVRRMLEFMLETFKKDHVVDRNNLINLLVKLPDDRFCDAEFELKLRVTAKGAVINRINNIDDCSILLRYIDYYPDDFNDVEIEVLRNEFILQVSDIVNDIVSDDDNTDWLNNFRDTLERVSDYLGEDISPDLFRIDERIDEINNSDNDESDEEWLSSRSQSIETSPRAAVDRMFDSLRDSFTE